MNIPTENVPVETEKRRGFLLSSLGVACLSLFAGSAALSSDLFKSFLSGNSKIDLGRPNQFKVGEVNTNFQQTEKIFVVRNLEGLYILSAFNSKGSPLKWSRSEDAFIASSGEKYYRTGIQIEGHSKKAITRFAVRLSLEGHAIANTTKRFKHEKGEWNHPESFLALA